MRNLILAVTGGAVAVSTLSALLWKHYNKAPVLTVVPKSVKDSAIVEVASSIRTILLNRDVYAECIGKTGWISPTSGFVITIEQPNESEANLAVGYCNITSTYLGLLSDNVAENRFLLDLATSISKVSTYKQLQGFKTPTGIEVRITHEHYVVVLRNLTITKD